MRDTSIKRCIALFVLGAAVLMPAAAQLLDSQVAVVRLYETRNISQREMREEERLIEGQTGRQISADDRRMLVDRKINEVLILQAAEEMNLRVTEEELQRAIAQARASLGQAVSEAQFRQLVQQQLGLSWDAYQEQLRRQALQEKYIMETRRSVLENMSRPGEEDIENYYFFNGASLVNPGMVRFDHLVVETRNRSAEEVRRRRQRAEELYAEIERGASTFDELVDRSVDDATYSAGDFGYVIAQDPRFQNLLGQDFIERVFAIDEGSTSDEVLESNVGFHIVRVTDRRSPRVPELDDPVLPGRSMSVREQIQNILLAQQQQRAVDQAYQDVVEELRAQAEETGQITVNEENLDW